MANSETQEPTTEIQCQSWWFALLAVLLIAAPVAVQIFQEPVLIACVIYSYLAVGILLNSWLILCTLLSPILGCFQAPPATTEEVWSRWIMQTCIGLLMGFLFDAIQTRYSDWRALGGRNFGRTSEDDADQNSPTT